MAAKSDFAVQYDIKQREEALKMLDEKFESVKSEIERIRALPGRRLKASEVNWLTGVAASVWAISFNIKGPK